MAALAWCGLLTQIPSKGDKLRLDGVKGSCQRLMAYCSKIESFASTITITECIGSLVIFVWSCLRCNPVLLKLIVGSAANRRQQAVLQPLFETAKALRGPLRGNVVDHGPSLLFHVLCFLNIAILTLDILYGLYLWLKIRREVLYLHYEGREMASVEVRNIMISLAVSPMSALCVSRYSLFNQYRASSKLSEALLSADSVKRQQKETSTNDSEEEVDPKQQDEEWEQEALYLLDDSLSKSKPFEMKDMEDVLELLSPTLLLWNANVYLLTAGMHYLYFFGALFTVSLAAVIWFKFSKNIGVITPLLLPLSVLLLEFFCFVFAATWTLIWHQQSAVAALLIAPLIAALILPLFWRRNGVLTTDCVDDHDECKEE